MQIVLCHGIIYSGSQRSFQGSKVFSLLFNDHPMALIQHLTGILKCTLWYSRIHWKENVKWVCDVRTPACWTNCNPAALHYLFTNTLMYMYYSIFTPGNKLVNSRKLCQIIWHKSFYWPGTPHSSISTLSPFYLQITVFSFVCPILSVCLSASPRRHLQGCPEATAHGDITSYSSGHLRRLLFCKIKEIFVHTK